MQVSDSGGDSNGDSSSSSRYKVYVITTDEAVKRKKKTLEALSKIPALANVTTLCSARDMEDTRRGCFNAHKRWVEDFLLETKEFAVVFEDDICFEEGVTPEDIEQKFRACMQFIQFKEPKPDIFFLGHMPFGRLQKISSFGGVVKSQFSTQTHAMVVSRAFAQNMLTWEYTPGMHIDQKIARTSKEQYAAYPQFVFQDDMGSTYHSRFIDKLLIVLRDCVGNVRTCRWLEKIWTTI